MMILKHCFASRQQKRTAFPAVLENFSNCLMVGDSQSNGESFRGMLHGGSARSILFLFTQASYQHILSCFGLFQVLQQEQDIDRIANTVVGSTENVKDANDQIKQAIQRNAGLRVYILFFLLVMSFTLLFLDWYND